MKIVITGALGYVGSSLIRQVTKDFPSVQIILIDNLSTGRPQSLSGITNHKKIHFIEADILNFNFESLKLQKGDFVVHLAALSRPAESYERPQDYLKINYYGALRVAKSCAKSGSRFLFPSTTSVYHQTGGKLIDEESSHLRPQTPYAESKLTAEEKIKKIPALSFTIFRFGTIYGVSPSVSVHTAVNKFCWQASAGLPLSIWKTAMDQYRPYLDLNDAVRLIIFMIKNPKSFNRRIFNAVTNHATPRMVLREISRHQRNLKVNRIHSKAMNQISYKVSVEPLLKTGFRFRGGFEKSIPAILSVFA